jgi:hypothetical protein
MTRVLRVLATQIELRMLLVVIMVMIALSLSSPFSSPPATSTM